MNVKRKWLPFTCVCQLTKGTFEQVMRGNAQRVVPYAIINARDTHISIQDQHVYNIYLNSI